MLITDIVCRQRKLFGELKICSKIISGLDEAVLKPWLVCPPIWFSGKVKLNRSILDYVINLEPVSDSCAAILTLCYVLAHLDTVS